MAPARNDLRTRRMARGPVSRCYGRSRSDEIEVKYGNAAINTIRRYGPGKFDTILDSYVYQVSMDGCLDEETGESETTGWYGIMQEDSDGSLATAIAKAAYEGGETLTLGETEMILRDFAGVILSEDSQGFVSVEYFETKAALHKAWRRIEDAVEEMTEADEAEISKWHDSGQPSKASAARHRASGTQTPGSRQRQRLGCWRPQSRRCVE